MDLKIFFEILVVGVGLVILQGIFAWKDGFLTQRQMRARGIFNGWSFMEHGGMWADVFVITPITARLMSKYHLAYFSKEGMATLAVSITVSLIMGYTYQMGGVVTPEAHTHNGRTTIAGWIHGLFAVTAIWVCTLAYFNLSAQPITKGDILIMSLLLTPFFFLGVVKFSERWTFDRGARWQVAILTIVLWVVTGIRLWHA